MSKNLRILLLEDSEDDALFVLRALKNGGYEPLHRRVDTEEAFKATLEGEEWDAIIADFSLPQFDALGALRMIQESGKDLPFIIVSGAIGESVAVEAMRSGAHDYILKGSLARLVPAVERELREAEVRRERRKAANALARSEERFRTLSESAPIGIFETDAGGRCTYVNPRWSVISGFSAEDTLGFGWVQAIHPEDREAVERSWRSAFAEGRDWSSEHRLKTPDGLVHWVKVKAARIFSENGQRTGSVGTVEDITQSKRSADALRAAQERLQHLVSSSPAVLYALKVNQGKLLPTWVSASIAQLTGYGPEETLSMEWWAEHLHLKADSLRLARSGLDEMEEEYRFRRKDGKEIWIRDEKRLLRTPEGDLVEVVGSWFDITERKLAEQELHASREQLRALAAHLQSVREEERKRIAREIHDELGQSLTGFKMDLAWIRTRLQAERGLQSRQQLLDKISAMGTLIDGMAILMRKLCSELRPGVLDDLGLTAAMEWLVREYQNRTGIRCELKLETGDLVVDPERSTALFRILQEILTNAARHAEASRVTVVMKRSPTHLFLEAEDNGRGIKESEMAGKKSLGLVGLRERAVILGGEVEIEGRPGKGTRVRVKMPLGGPAAGSQGSGVQGSRASEQKGAMDLHPTNHHH